jgi:hypothetical protein
MRMPTDKKKAIAPRKINSARGSRRFFRSADRRAASRIQDTVSSGLVCRRSACPTKGSSATLGDGFAEACQRSPSSHDDGAADGTTGLAGIKVRALVRGEAASSTSVPARSADNGPGVHMAKIAVGA